MNRPELLCDVSRETEDLLSEYVVLLKRWNKRINLVSRNTIKDVWTRHVNDSLQLVPLIAPAVQTCCDLGSGAGFPGVVLAIAGRERITPLKVTCVEADQRKAVFLRTVSRETGVAFSVETTRIERLLPQGADLVTARALAPLDQLLGYAARHRSEGGRALFLKGAGYDVECKDAEKNWCFESTMHSSKTDPSGVIVEIGGLSRV